MSDLISRQVLDLWNRYKPTIAVDAIEYDRELKQLLSTNLAEVGTDVPDINVGDMISREQAIRWVKTECNPYGKPTLDFESGKKVIEHLEQMPPA